MKAAAPKAKKSPVKKVAPLKLTGLPKIGDRRPGGVVGAIMLADGKRPAYLLIVADADVGESASLTFGSYGTDVKGLSDWDGLANTKKLTKTKGAHPAAEFCKGLVIDGCKDFYLLARHEARLLFASAKRLVSPDGYYWTSTQCSALNAFVQCFSDGGQSGFKFNGSRVRAVRRELIN